MLVCSNVNNKNSAFKIVIGGFRFKETLPNNYRNELILLTSIKTNRKSKNNNMRLSSGMCGFVYSSYDKDEAKELEAINNRLETQKINSIIQMNDFIKINNLNEEGKLEERMEVINEDELLILSVNNKEEDNFTNSNIPLTCLAHLGSMKKYGRSILSENKYFDHYGVEFYNYYVVKPTYILNNGDKVEVKYNLMKCCDMIRNIKINNEMGADLYEIKWSMNEENGVCQSNDIKIYNKKWAKFNEEMSFKLELDIEHLKDWFEVKIRTCDLYVSMALRDKVLMDNNYVLKKEPFIGFY